MDKLWGSQDSIFSARFKFFHQQQTSTKTVDDFISRLTYTVRDCAFGNLGPKRVESAMLMQTLIAAPFGFGVALCHVMSSGEELPIIYASRTMS